jgi:hypothetical protein
MGSGEPRLLPESQNSWEMVRALLGAGSFLVSDPGGLLAMILDLFASYSLGVARVRI